MKVALKWKVSSPSPSIKDTSYIFKVLSMKVIGSDSTGLCSIQLFPPCGYQRLFQIHFLAIDYKLQTLVWSNFHSPEWA